MNKVYNSTISVTPLTSEQLANAANAVYDKSYKPFTAEMFTGPESRIAGAGHGYCNGNCEFVLLPLSDPAVQEGQKRYMTCRKCGAVSHL